MKDLLNQLQRDSSETIQFLEAMVNQDSPSTEKALVDPFVSYVGSQFKRIGGNVSRIHSDRFGDHLRVTFDGPATGPGRGRRSGTGRVLLLGHTDTVFGAGEASKRPFKVEGNLATGPGVFDMKAGIALMWAALRALRPPPRPITVLLTSDEEIGSSSSRELIQQEAAASQAVLVLEPSLPGGALKTSRKGVGRFTVKATGRAAHAGLEPERGINAIEEIAHQVLALQRLSSPEPGPTVTVGVVAGGSRVNVVPADAAVDVDVRISSHEEAARISTAILGLLPRLPGATLQIRGGINRPPMERTADTIRLFGVAQDIAKELGCELNEGSTGGASDGNFTAAMGIPTLDGLGAIGGGAHSLDEFVEVESLPLRAALIAGLLCKV